MVIFSRDLAIRNLDFSSPHGDLGCHGFAKPMPLLQEKTPPEVATQSEVPPIPSIQTKLKMIKQYLLVV